MFGKVFNRSTAPDAAERRFRVARSPRKPITLKYRPKGGGEILLAKETPHFKGEIRVGNSVDSIQHSFEGENIKDRKNAIRLEIEY